jgi:sugar lactone lactonase YvrE
MWHPNRKTVWWIDINGQEYFEAKLDGTPARRLKSSQKIGAVVPTASGGLLAALQDGIYRVDPESGASTLWVKAPGHDAREFRFNDGKVDPRGRFWAGTLALDDRRGQSRLYRFDSDRSVATMREGVSISNGIAWSPDGGTMYYIDSPERTVQSFAYDIERGTISSPRIAIELTEADGWPDGCSMDAEGMLWVAHWGAAKVTRWDPRSARLLSTLKLPVQNVTSCAFAGPGLDELFITTAKEAARAALEPEAGFIFRHRPGVAGLPLANFAGA